MTRQKRCRYPLIFLAVFVALCLCDASKKQAKERTLDMEAAAEKMIFFEEAMVYRRKKYMRAYRRRRLVATRSTLLPRATVATLSHGISYLLGR